MKRHVMAVGLLLFLINSCGNFSRTIIYNESSYARLNQAHDITIKTVDGQELHFYKMNVEKMDEEFIYVQCWEKKNEEPKAYKFVKSSIVIQSEHFSGSQTAWYVAGVALTVGIIILLNYIIY